MKPLVFPLGARRKPASDKLGKKIVRIALAPGDVRDRLTRDIYSSRDQKDPLGLLELTYLKVIETEEADRKLERAIKKGLVSRFHGEDWFTEAVEKKIITPIEAEQLREVEELVNRVISVDHFDRQELKPHYRSIQTSSAEAAE